MFRKAFFVGFFGIIAIIYFVGVQTDMTWTGLGADQFDYVVAAEKMGATRPTGYPLYILVGWLFERLPGNPFWALGLVSAVCTIGSAVVIWLMVRHLGRRLGIGDRDSLIGAYAGAAVYAGGLLVWSQGVIAETYSPTTFMMLLAVYLVFTKHYHWAALCVGLGLGLHHLVVFAFVPLAIYAWWLHRKGLAKFSWPILVVLCILGASVYLQCFLCTQFPPETTNGESALFTQTTGSLPMAYQLPLQSTPGRLEEFLFVVLVDVGVGLPALFFLRRSREIDLLLVIVLLVASYYFFSFPPQWIRYMVPALGFACVLIGVGVSRFLVRHVRALFVVLPLAALVCNLVFFDIGRSVDSNGGETTARELYETLDSVPDDSIIYTSVWGHAWLVAYYYGMEHDWRVVVVNQGGILYYPYWYRDEIERRGVNLPQDYPGFEGSYYKEWVWSYPSFDREAFIVELCKCNSDRAVYVGVLKEYSDEKVVFGFEPVVHDASGDWLVPAATGDIDRISGV